MTISPVVITLLGFLLAALTALITGAVTWGMFRAQLEHQQKKIDALSTEVRELTTNVQTLTTQVAVLTDRHSRLTPPT